MTRTPARRQSPLALVVSLVALVVALSGTAVAAGLVTGRDIKNNSVTTADVKNSTLRGKDIKNNQVSLADLTPGARSAATKQNKPLFAVVDAAGNLVRGNGVVDVTPDGAGFYFVEFSRSTLRSGISASVISDGGGDGQVNYRQCGPAVVDLSCSTGGTDPHFVFVNTEDSTGANTSKPFSLVVGPVGSDFTAPRPAGRPGSGGAEGGR